MKVWSSGVVCEHFDVMKTRCWILDRLLKPGGLERKASQEQVTDWYLSASVARHCQILLMLERRYLQVNYTASL